VAVWEIGIGLISSGQVVLANLCRPENQ